MEPDRAAYDRGGAIFSPDGRLYQVEYAREAVGRGAPCVGVQVADGVVLAARRRRPSPLLEAESVEKLHRLADGVGAASAGHAADARRLVAVARRAARRERLRYGETAGAGVLARAVGDHVQARTQRGGERPYGVGLLVGGTDGDGPALYEADPGGGTRGWRAVAVGADREAVQGRLEDGYADDLSGAEGVGLALDALAGDDALAPADVAVATVDADGYAVLSGDERRSALSSRGLLDGAAS